MRYEVERLYLTDPAGRPQQTLETPVVIDAASSRRAAEAFLRREGARLLGPISDAPGDLCMATAWNAGRLYVITVWRVGHRPPHETDATPVAN